MLTIMFRFKISLLVIREKFKATTIRTAKRWPRRRRIFPAISTRKSGNRQIAKTGNVAQKRRTTSRDAAKRSRRNRVSRHRG
jgi:hypothetical protein